jgi:hypothetical protein
MAITSNIPNTITIITGLLFMISPVPARLPAHDVRQGTLAESSF